MNIYIDFDGTIVTQKDGYQREIGEPIMPMIDRINKWIKQGHNITIFTARASKWVDNFEKLDIEMFCVKYFGRVLPITAIKHHECDLYIDDKAIRVERNTGKLLNNIEELYE